MHSVGSALTAPALQALRVPTAPAQVRLACPAVTHLQVGPGSAMLAALGGLSSTYHLVKWLEWRAYEAARVAEAERLLREHYRSLASGGGGSPDTAKSDAALGPPLGSAAGRSGALPHGRVLPGGLPGGPAPPPGWR